MTHALLVAPAGHGVGLTTVCLGLVRALDRRGVRVGFCKPLAQPGSGGGPDTSQALVQLGAAITAAEPLAADRVRALLSAGEDQVVMEEAVARYQQAAQGCDVVIIEGLVPQPGMVHAMRVNHLLAKALTARPGDSVLDMGTGSGAIGLIAAAAGASVVAVDIASPAVECAQLNARALGLDGRFDVRAGNLFSALGPTEAFSLIAFNLPFMEGQPRDSLETAMYDPHWRTMKGFLGGARERLLPGGRILVAFSDCGDLDVLHREASVHSLTIQEIDRLTLDLEFYVYSLTPA